ncbi:MAG: hypothetical protein HOH37_06460 [Gammaproteobacteria bacterium]|nr:hypothetical protein [Gammaproteobacteria bacterium]
MNEIDKLLEVMRRLRDPENGCSWDVQEALDRLVASAELTEGGIKH